MVAMRRGTKSGSCAHRRHMSLRSRFRASGAVEMANQQADIADAFLGTHAENVVRGKFVSLVTASNVACDVRREVESK